MTEQAELLSQPKRLGVLTALPEEAAGVVSRLTYVRTVDAVHPHTVHAGLLEGLETVVMSGRVGKASAAIGATRLALEHRCDAVVFVGVAGGLDPVMCVGDAAIAEACAQHDVDASPLFPPCEVPLTGITRFGVDRHLTDLLDTAATEAARQLRQRVDGAVLASLKIEPDQANIARGLVVSGDQFIESRDTQREILELLPGALVVDMETAAAAQACHELAVPFAAVRLVSDSANDTAAIDFMRYLTEVASPHLGLIAERFAAKLAAPKLQENTP
ncbi:MAG: 5'-methylthioadenosine/adenosylhomocysteine nucleosidase [Planctomycetota bacterium]